MTEAELDELIAAARTALLNGLARPTSVSTEGQSVSFDVAGMSQRLESLLKLKALLFPYEIRSVVV